MSASGRVSERLRDVVLKGLLLGVLATAYLITFRWLHALIGNPVFLAGQLVCLLAAALLGLRGALVMIVVVTLIDRNNALLLAGPETGRVAAVVSLLVKLVLAGGLGLVLDSRRRLRLLNTRLSSEVEARHSSEQALKRSESLHRALVESLGEGVGLFARDGRIVFANEALASTLHVPREQLVGRRFEEFFVTRVAQGVLTACGEGLKRTYEAALRDSAASLLLVTETKLTLRVNGEALILRVVRDLTESVVRERRQRELEREIQRSQSLQSLAVMAGGVAHDFNNLLCGVVGNVEIARRKLPAGTHPMLSQCLAEIGAFADEAAQLSKQMLAYAGQRSLAIEAVDPNAELASALRLLHAIIESKARLVLELADGLPEVAADRFQLRQVVTNLALNALDAMVEERGVLTLKTHLFEVDTEQQSKYQVCAGTYVLLSVEDTGAGIASEVRERLFEPFFSTKAPGRGMGLAAAAGIVRAHRGWLGVQETSARGTKFGVLLPVAHASIPRRASRPATLRAPPASRNILLIDDEPAVRVVTGRLLGELGQRVLTAASGEQGLALFSERPQDIDLVVLDLTMPAQSGEQVLAELRMLRPDVPVVISSGFQPTDASRLLSVPNVIGFLDKPHTLTSLEVILASLGTGAREPGVAAVAGLPAVSH